MPFVEQTIIIKAPIPVVMQALNDVEKIPTWATVTGTIDNITGRGAGMRYEWHYAINNLSFSGKSEVIEQTERTLITKTTGDIDSIWTVNLSPAGKDSTAIRVLVEYSSPNIFVELLADLVMQQLHDPEVARKNMARFKEFVEKRTQEAKVIANR